MMADRGSGARVVPPHRPHGLANLIAVFGNPHAYASNPGEWERQVLVRMPLRHPLPYAYGKQTITHIRAHKYVVGHLVETLAQCGVRTPHLRGLIFGGTYVWRPMRGGRKLSTHTWGIAIDLDPARNPLGVPWKDDGKMLPPEIIETFESMGWQWGGRWKRPDAQHFQWVSGY